MCYAMGEVIMEVMRRTLDLVLMQAMEQLPDGYTQPIVVTKDGPAGNEERGAVVEWFAEKKTWEVTQISPIARIYTLHRGPLSLDVFGASIGMTGEAEVATLLGAADAEIVTDVIDVSIVEPEPEIDLDMELEPVRLALELLPIEDDIYIGYVNDMLVSKGIKPLC